MVYYVNITLSIVFRFFKTNFKKWVIFVMRCWDLYKSSSDRDRFCLTAAAG